MLRSAALVLCLASFLSGCAAVAAAGVVGLGVVQYHRNEVAHDFGTELDETWKGTLEALRSLGIEPGLAELGPSEGLIEHQELVVRVERHAEGFTRVRVRFGTFHSADHQRRAEVVLLEIGAAIEGQDELRAWAEQIEAQKPQAEPKPR
jgi:hypothetical protein